MHGIDHPWLEGALTKIVRGSLVEFIEAKYPQLVQGLEKIKDRLK